MDLVLVQTCYGGSAVLPCHSPNGEGLAVEGVSLKRQRDRGAVEVVYDSKQQQHRRGAAGFPAERVQLSSALGASGITYNVTLQQLQPDDSALYSCQLLLRGRPDSSTRLGRRGFFVSVQGESHSSRRKRRVDQLYVFPSSLCHGQSTTVVHHSWLLLTNLPTKG